MSEFSKVTNDYEMLTVLSNIDLICTIYRPPDGNLERFLDFFEELLEYVSRNKLRLICGGDFNLNMLQDNSAVREFTTRIHSFAFVNPIKTPTRITSSSSTLLDFCRHKLRNIYSQHWNRHM